MANITTTEAAGFIPEIWAATALGALKANTVMARLVNRNYENQFQGIGDIINVPRRGTLTVNTKAANTVVTLQTPTADTIPLTLNRHKEVSFLVEDIAKAQANQDFIQGYIDDAVKAIAEEVDAAILALYSGFSTTPIDATTGSGGVTIADITEARRLLNAAKVPQEDRHIVWHEDAESEVLNLEEFTRANWDPGNTDALVNARMGRKFGFTHYMDQNVVVATNECKNLAFHRDAIMLAFRPLPPPPPETGARAVTMTEDGFAIRVLYGYNMSHLALQVTLDVLYGVAEHRDNHAVVIRSTEL